MEGDQKKTLKSPSMAEIPKDIIEIHILPKLPIESVLKFKVVCKSFNAVISSPEFIDEHLRRSASTNSDRLVIINVTHPIFPFTSHVINSGHGFHVFDFDALGSPSFFLSFPDTLNSQVHMFGSCNGLMCVGTTVNKLMLLNPFTGMSFNVPPISLPKLTDDNIGFGFDDWSKDYKIVRISSNSQRMHVMVYSLMANSWKLIESTSTFRSHPFPNYNGMLIDNHLLHWIFIAELDPPNDVNLVDRIRCFDLRIEKWVDDVVLPHDHVEILDSYKLSENLGVFDGHLCLLIPKMLESSLDQVDMWVMKEYGAKDSWEKVLGVSDSCVTSTLQMCPLGSSQGSIIDPGPQHEILLARGRKHTNPGTERVVLIWYNIEAKKTRLSQVHKVHDFPPYFSDVCICTKSLVPLPGGSFIRKEKQTLPEMNHWSVENMVPLNMRLN